MTESLPGNAAKDADGPPERSSDDDVDDRMAEIEKILDHSATPHLDKCELVAEWVGHSEAKLSVCGHVVPKPKGGRPEGGIARAARALAVPGKTIGARRKFVERAIRIAGIWPEAKAAARAAGLDKTQSALLAIASEPSREAQIATIADIAAGRKAPRRKARARDSDSREASPSEPCGHTDSHSVDAIDLELAPHRCEPLAVAPEAQLAINVSTAQVGRGVGLEFNRPNLANKSEIDQSKPASIAALIEFAKYVLARMRDDDQEIALTLIAIDEVKEFRRLANRVRLALGQAR